MLLSIVNKLQYKLYYRSTFPCSTYTVNKRKNFAEHDKDLLRSLQRKKTSKKWKKRWFLKAQD